MADQKLSHFHVLTTPYKTIEGLEIPAHILIPKSIADKPGKYPVLVRFHGGFLVTGAALFPDWVAPWSINLVLSTPSILVMPDYRLLPEASGLEILTDIQDFWSWLQSPSNGLSSYLSSSPYSGVDLDLAKIGTIGDSAGGFLSIWSSLSQGKEVVKAAIASYPMVDLRGKWYAEKDERKKPFGAALVEEEVIQKYEGGKWVVAATPMDRVDLAVGLVQWGKWREVYERDGEGKDGFKLFLEDAMEGRGKGEVGWLFAFHGTGDSAVPWEETRDLVGRWGEKFGGDSVMGVWKEGLEHGFDDSVDEESEEGKWLKDGLVRFKKEWLGN
ncbi:Alpha beta hydrolase fold-1 protein [Rutstroemia sp. NJR-2017a WRK4]|nr:Alpha beta hydrolase fold-1 protein [Rutstroemia sp. NJR-2017a WRK4]